MTAVTNAKVDATIVRNHPVHDNTTCALLKDRSTVNLVRFDKAMAERRLSLNLLRLEARLIDAPNAAAMPHIDSVSTGMRKAVGMLMCFDVVAHRTTIIAIEANDS